MKKKQNFAIKLLLFIPLLFLTFAFIPLVEDPIDKLVQSLQHWTDSIPQEKIYLHMDKPYYALGDTIWFKGYVTIGSRHQLSALSGAVYVDLISEKDSVLKSLKLPATSGMVIGDFTLDDDFREGSYRIRAYTQWMRNAGPDYFYDHTFTVGDLVNNNIVTKVDYQYKDIDNKPVLIATLNYTNDTGKPLAEKNIDYQIIMDKKVVWTRSAKTDANGSIPVRISNEKQVDLRGSYIHTTLQATGTDKYKVTKDFPIKATLSQSDVQFFPESGELVNGIASTVAFKAVGVDGLGISIKGKIIDEANNETTTITTTHAGMGSFPLLPQAGKSYSAIIDFEDGTTKTIALPKADNEGYVLAIYQPNTDSVLVRINASASLQQSIVNLIAQTNGETIFAAPIKLEKAITSVWLEKKAFPTGIAQFTLFNSTGEPLNERIDFIRSDDLMQLTLKTDKSSYKSREQVQVTLESKDSKGKPTFGNFSVSVIDESKVPSEEANESSIFSNILLSSDIKGYVEKPNYYFTNESPEVNKDLDNLMLTQGYRRFSWKELTSTTATIFKPQFQAEGLGISISGRVTTLTDKILPDATVNLISLKANIVKSAKTDAEGRFKFAGIFLTDSIKFSLQARNAKNSNKVKLTMDSIPNMQITKNKNLGDVSTNITATLKTYMDNGKKEDNLYEQMGQLDKVRRLREVKIRARKIKVPTYAAQGILQIPEGHSDQTFKFTEPDLCANLGLCLQGMLHGIVFKSFVVRRREFQNYPYCRQLTKDGDYELLPMQVIIDGHVIDPEEAGDIFDNNVIAAVDIVKIEIVNINQSLMGLVGGASIMIYTNRGMVHKSSIPSVANITPKGFNKVRDFYSPKYNLVQNASTMPDLRTTVYWDPYIKTDVSGKTTINFFNTDGPGTYKVIVEGINVNGQLGRQIYRYKII